MEAQTLSFLLMSATIRKRDGRFERKDALCRAVLLELPQTAGREAAGVVEAFNARLTQARVGDAVEPAAVFPLTEHGFFMPAGFPAWRGTYGVVGWHALRLPGPLL